MRGALGRYWRSQREALLDGLDAVRRYLTETVDDAGREFDRLWNAVADIDNGALAGAVDDITGEASIRGARSTAADLGVGVSLDLDHPRAAAFMAGRGAALVTRIDEETRRQMRGVLTRGVADGTSYSRVADEINRRFAGFSDRSALGHIRTRAELVAVQEVGMAYEAAGRELADDLTRAGWQLERRIIVTPDDRLCPECIDAESAGWIAHGELFPSGVDAAPVHVGCRCATETRSAQQGSALPDTSMFQPA